LRNGRHQAERSAAEWLLRSWGHEETVHNALKELPKTSSPPENSERDWWLTTGGYTMTIVGGPVTFTMGSAEDEPGREGSETLTETTIAHSFAVSTHEVTMQQYQRFDPNANFAWDVADDPQCPANRVSFVDAMRYCRWLSEQENVPEDQMCYPTLSEIEPGDGALAEPHLLRTGYRLLTEEEWEYVCRAGSTTRWFSGASEEHLRPFAWFALSSGERLHRVGLLRPNLPGLFDISGNVAEWCHSSAGEGKYVLRGGTYDHPARRVRSAQRNLQPNRGLSFTGFRIARTIASDP
jgi:formylglycine-generating enzyme required for sulfatase activity